MMLAEAMPVTTASTHFLLPDVSAHNARDKNTILCIIKEKSTPIT